MLFFAITSPNIILGDNPTFGTSTTMVTTGLVLGLVAVLVMNYAYPEVHAWLVAVFIKKRLLTGSLMLGVVLAGQIFLIIFVHPASGFDAGMLHYAATSAKHVREVNVMAYYSLNQNNLPIMLFMHWLTELTGQTSWLFFDFGKFYN